MILGKKKVDDEPIFVTMSPQNVDYSKAPYFIEILDDFVKKFYDGDYEISRDAYSVPCGRDNIKSNLGKYLNWSIRNYTVAKSEKGTPRLESCADDLLTWLTMARGANLILEGVGVKTKFERYEKQIQQLQEESEQLRKKLILTEKENEERKKFIDSQLGGSSVVE